MNPVRILRETAQLGWSTSISIILANVRLYGWAATLRKAYRRARVSGNFYQSYLYRLERLKIDQVDKSSDLFSRPCILIIGTLDLPQCKKYRVLQKVEIFASMGWRCYFAHYLDESRIINYLQISTALIFYRVPANRQMDDYLSEARRLGIKTFYDIDDPIFSEVIYAENSNLKHIETRERMNLLKGTIKYREAMKKVDALILSTNCLKEIASLDFDKPTFLWRNLADSTTLSMVESIRKEHADNGSDAIVIAYASGSRAHDEDFRVASAALVKIMRQYESISLRVIGHLSIPQELQVFEGRINTQPFAGYLQYLEALSQADICIVPLIIDRFNACKSAIRYIEASLCEVPTIASAVGEFTEIILNGSDGYLADSYDEWYSRLERLVQDKDLRVSMGVEARKKVMAYHTVSTQGAIGQDIIDQFSLNNE